ncbi:MAG TPA: biotin/lipoyl-containing protein, partial [Candidatus Dormibacteraeota bacterium]|nr:biotin/lipoyl-containing protein [Candidatus Dormibacteraeota bacterium]
MAVDVIMPQMGESIFEGTITKWLKKPGDKIDRDEPLFEISTDKVDAEIPSPAAGVLKEIKVSEGQTVPVQTVVGTIDAAGAAAAAAPAASAKPAPAAQPKAEATKPAVAPPPPSPAPAAAPKPAQPVSAAPPASAPEHHAGDGDKIRTSPLVRRIARENQIDLSQIPGTGAAGRVSKRDILAAVEGGPTSAPAAAPASGPT